MFFCMHSGPSKWLYTLLKIQLAASKNPHLIRGGGFDFIFSPDFHIFDIHFNVYWNKDVGGKPTLIPGGPGTRKIREGET